MKKNQGFRKRRSKRGQQGERDEGFRNTKKAEALGRSGEREGHTTLLALRLFIVNTVFYSKILYITQLYDNVFTSEIRAVKLLVT